MAHPVPLLHDGHVTRGDGAALLGPEGLEDVAVEVSDTVVLVQGGAVREPGGALVAEEGGRGEGGSVF